MSGHYQELSREVRSFNRQYLAERATPEGLRLQQIDAPANDPTLLCERYGFVREVLNPLPFSITRIGEHLNFAYEEWNRRRTVFLDDRDFPNAIEATAMGYSIGSIKDQTLIIETRGLIADIYVPNITGGGHSDQLTAIEQYTLSQNNSVLTAELTLIDPVTLTTPMIFMKHWVSAPDIVLLEDSCSDVPGQY